MPDFSLKRRDLLAAGAVGGLMALAGVPFAAAQDAARRTLRVGMSGFPATVDPAMANATAVRRVVKNVFDKLLAFDLAANMALKPALAERWERVSGSALKLSLRHGVTFHDGSPFTAADVAFSLSPEHLLGPGMAGKTTAMQTLDTIDRVEVVDSHTVIVHTKGEDGLIEKRLAAWHSEIVSKRAFEAAKSWDAWLVAPVGTGPYKIVSQKLDVDVVLAAHDAYWGGRPPYAGVHFRIIPELASRMNALVANEVDFITDISPDMFPEIERRTGLEIAGGPVQNIRALSLDVTDPVLGKLGVRRALSLAIDRKALVQALWQNRLTIPNGYQLPTFGDAYIKDFPAPAYDPDLARQLLHQAGYAGEKITYRLLNNYYPAQVAGAQIMIEMWRAVGLNVEIQMMENFAQVQRTPIRAIYDNSNTAVFPDPLAHAWRIFGPNGEGPKLGTWKNQEYFDLGEKLKATSDAKARRPILRRMLEITSNEDPGCIILHGSGQFYAKRKDVPFAPDPSLDLDFGPLNLAYAKK